MKIVYCLEEVEYYGYDMLDKERVEKRFIWGYFNDIYLLMDAINQCLKCGIDKNKLCISSFFTDISSRQKNIYVLYHEYSIVDNEEYTDYYYTFEPLSNKKKCMELKEIMKMDSKYKFKVDRDYSACPPDGFSVMKFTLNSLTHTPPIPNFS